MRSHLPSSLYVPFLLLALWLPVLNCKGLRVDPNFLFVDEDWSLETPLAVSICSDRFDQVRIASGNDDDVFALIKSNDTCGGLKLNKELDSDQLHSDGTRWQSFNLLFESGKKRRITSLDIQVVDVNDNAPVFVNWRPEVNVSEKLSVGSVVQRIQTFDPDTGVGGVVRLLVEKEKFRIENERCSNSYCHGDLVLSNSLDYESNNVEHVTVVARDGASLTKHANEASASLTVNVIDEQDTPPTFLTTVTEPLKIAESLPVGAKILQVNAVDGDRFAPVQNEIAYSLATASEYFQVDARTGALSLKKRLDRELESSFVLTIVATEQDEARMSSEMTVEVTVVDVDDNAPQCLSHEYVAHLNRVSKTFEVDKAITVFDMDLGKNAQFNVALSGEFSDSFAVAPTKVQGTSDLTVNVTDFDSLEYVTGSKIVLELRLTPRGGVNAGEPTVCLVVVHLASVPEKVKPPVFKFSKSIFHLRVMENMPPPQVLANIAEGPVAGVLFTIEGDGASAFAINGSRFIVNEVLDAEQKRKYNLKLRANDNGKASTADVNVEVLDENDNAPAFERAMYEFNVTEETEGTFYVKAIDADSPPNANITYKLVGNVPSAVKINGRTGQIKVGKIDVDKTKQLRFDFDVVASDNGTPMRNSTSSIILNVADVNDNMPHFVKKAFSTIIKCDTPVNTTVLKVRAVDADATGSTVQYELPGEVQTFLHIDPTSGIIRLVKPLPRKRNEINFNVIARDNGVPPQQAVARATIRLSDCNAPVTTPRPVVTTRSTKLPTTVTEFIAEETTTTTVATFTATRSTAITPAPTTFKSDSGLPHVELLNRTFNKLEGGSRIFVPRHLMAEVQENAAVGTKVLELDLNANDSDANYEFHFSTKNTAHAGLLKVNRHGELKVADKIDFENVKQINGSIFARSDRRNLLFATVSVSVVDVNDNTPVFRIPTGHKVLLPVTSSVGTLLDLPYPLATDADASAKFSEMVYDMVENSTSKARCFKINKNTSMIQVVQPLGACGSDVIALTVFVGDFPQATNMTERRFANVTILVNMTAESITTSTTTTAEPAVNLTAGIFNSIPTELSIFEDEPLGSVLMILSQEEILQTIKQNNVTNSKNLTVTFSVRNSDLIELANGCELKLMKSVKGYVNQKLCVQIEAKLDADALVPQLVTKHVCLVIKSRPKSPVVHWPIQNSVHKFKENTRYDALLAVNATSTILDPKLSGLKYGLIETKADDWKEFSIDSRGVLKAVNLFDFEEKEKYNLQVEVCDFNDSCTTVAFRIQVEDLNDHCPAFMETEETFEVPENQPVGADGAQVGSFKVAEDGDGTAEKRSVCYRIENEEDSIFFLPDSRKAMLFVRKSLDREEQDSHNVSVIAQDCHFKERDLNCTDSTEKSAKAIYQKLIRIKVLDVNDNFPKFTQKDYYGKVIERKTKFGAKVLTVKARDPDFEPDGLHYSMSSAVRTETDVIPREEAPFHINSVTGDIASHIVYDSKVFHSYNFRVVVKDGAGHEDEASVTISVINYNEQVELVFDVSEEHTRKHQRDISKLMFDVTTMYMVVDDVTGRGNATNMLVHFLERDKLLAPAAKAVQIFEETKSETAQRARHELRQQHGLRGLHFDASTNDLMNGVLSAAFIDVYTLTVGAVFVALFLLCMALVAYLCCSRSRKASAKLNSAPINQELIYGNGKTNSVMPELNNTLAHPKPLPAARLPSGGMTLPSHPSNTLAPRAAPPPTSHQQTLPREEGGTTPPETHLFDALQSTEL